MIVFIKTQTAAIIATCVDFLITILCKEVLGVWYMAATVLGTVCGGVVSFLLGRRWVFKNRETKVQTQAVRYFLVWNGNFLLNISGVFVLTNYLNINYIVSKVFVSTLLGFTYSYLLQKKYVFR